tara:strand:- start:523 stop:801 length:279 start_codon:yes stop_codon:yes gene_type:complete
VSTHNSTFSIPTSSVVSQLKTNESVKIEPFAGDKIEIVGGVVSVASISTTSTASSQEIRIKEKINDKSDEIIICFFIMMVLSINLLIHFPLF